MFSTRVTVRDAIAIAMVLFSALFFFIAPWQSREFGTTLVIASPNGTAEYTLSENREIALSSQGVSLTVMIENGVAYVRESSCPDGVCRTSGRISKSGETILCAPAGVRLSVKGGASDVDHVAG